MELGGNVRIPGCHPHRLSTICIPGPERRALAGVGSKDADQGQTLSKVLLDTTLTVFLLYSFLFLEIAGPTKPTRWSAMDDLLVGYAPELMFIYIS